MHARLLTRRASLLGPLLLAACAGEEERTDFPPLRYAYLPPIRLNVATIAIEQRFMPSGVAPDVSMLDPVRPVDALRTMAEDRLKAFGTAGRAVFAIQDASLTRQGDVINGTMAVVLTVYGPNDAPAGYAEARVALRHTGRIDGLRGTLYDMTRKMLDDMNVEFEYQVRRNLRDWLISETSVPTPVEQAPLEQVPSAAGPSS
jgi:hypothetical protein